ncbi:TetR/AcrR family transcriptional regulator [Streptomyces qinzhouensis]|uniref:TetR/AcrR family transcriptional regulator n=1 Tax=Streptomyces qinzhouensis TaxID=2599401 RepID=A0A5B8J7K5_9ACTN|nr:TetR/AcrR family transcriptional regulator [Streptomyces qinzhouensis]QDY77206.1 TetR/AcrR family transcriptional regulator [Streptomyces qinzhouensis]
MSRSRLTPEREAELFEAVLELLREVGYDSLTMDAVAARTRSSKATLYRQWHSKPELVATALQYDGVPGADAIDTGSLRGDFHGMLSQTDECQMEKDSALLRSLVHAVHTNPDLYDALRTKVIAPEEAALRTVIDRAVERGEISVDNPAREFVPHMLFGVFFAVQMIEDRVPTMDFMKRYVDAVVLPALEAR